VPQPRKRYRVLVVDDEEIIASTLATILRNSGFEATHFSSPLEALRVAQADAPDLLISDVAMPLLSGVELAIAVRKHCPDCKILLFSGQAFTAHLLEAARKDGHDFELLMKPIHPTDLLKKVQKVTETIPPSAAD